MEDTNKKMIFRAVNQYEETNVMLPTESASNKGFIKWGDDNDYPQFLRSLYDNVATLHSIVDGTVDYVLGEGVTIDDIFLNERVNANDEPIDLVRGIAKDLLVFGGFAVDVVRNKEGKVASLYYIPLERIRTDEKGEMFYYSKDWSKSGRVKYISYPAFDINKKDPHSIFYYNNNRVNTYPTPVWAASIISCQIENEVNHYHLNSISNGFAASYMISMNNGIPQEQEADEIEDAMIEKFTGSANGGRLLITFANDKDHAPVLSKLETDDAGEKYKSLVERAKQEIFTSFRALPQLFGINLNTGFSTQEYADAFKLYNKTMVAPLQKTIIRSLQRILNLNVDIKPFVIEYENKIISEQ